MYDQLDTPLPIRHALDCLTSSTSPAHITPRIKFCQALPKTCACFSSCTSWIVSGNIQNDDRYEKLTKCIQLFLFIYIEIYSMTNDLDLIVIFLQIQSEDAILSRRFALSRVIGLPAVCTVVISALVVPLAMTSPRVIVLLCGVVWPV